MTGDYPRFRPHYFYEILVEHFGLASAERHFIGQFRGRVHRHAVWRAGNSQPGSSSRLANFGGRLMRAHELSFDPRRNLTGENAPLHGVQFNLPTRTKALADALNPDGSRRLESGLAGAGVRNVNLDAGLAWRFRSGIRD